MKPPNALKPVAQAQVQRAWAMAIQYAQRDIWPKHTSEKHAVNGSARIAKAHATLPFDRRHRRRRHRPRGHARGAPRPGRGRAKVHFFHIAHGIRLVVRALYEILRED